MERVRLGLTPAASAVLVLFYPLAVFFALGRISPRAVGLGLIALLAARALLLRPTTARAYGRALGRPALALAAIAGLTALVNHPILLLAAPALASLAFLASFGRSLRAGPPVVETLARATNPDLTPAEQRYCRSVTLVWCGVFATNAAAVLALAAFAPRSWWAAFSGLGVYLVIGGVFGAEYVVRRARFRRFEPHLVDRVLARVLPRAREV